MNDFREYRTPVSGVSLCNNVVVSAAGWRKPPLGWVKVNTDAHVSTITGGRFGMVIRDADGIILAADAKHVNAKWLASMMGAAAARHGVLFARQLWYKNDVAGM